MSEEGQPRHFDRGLVTSGPPPETDILGAGRHVANAPKIGIGGRLATPPLPHHRAYGSVPRRFDRVRPAQA